MPQQPWHPFHVPFDSLFLRLVEIMPPNNTMPRNAVQLGMYLHEEAEQAGGSRSLHRAMFSGLLLYSGFLTTGFAVPMRRNMAF